MATDRIRTILVLKIMNEHNMILELERSTKRKPESIRENRISFYETDLFLTDWTSWKELVFSHFI